MNAMRVLTVYAHHNPLSFCHAVLEQFTHDRRPGETWYRSWYRSQRTQLDATDRSGAKPRFRPRLELAE
jgi:putative NADPH-quinone reductase